MSDKFQFDKHSTQDTGNPQTLAMKNGNENTSTVMDTAVIQELRQEIRSQFESLRADHREHRASLLLPLRNHQLHELDGVHEMPLFPVLSRKSSNRFSTHDKLRLHFVCPVCLQKADNSKAGPKGKGYAVYIDKEWFSKALPYLKMVVLVLRIGLRVAGVPGDLLSLMEEACLGAGWWDSSSVLWPGEGDLSGARVHCLGLQRRMSRALSPGWHCMSEGCIR